MGQSPDVAISNRSQGWHQAGLEVHMLLSVNTLFIKAPLEDVHAAIGLGVLAS